MRGQCYAEDALECGKCGAGEQRVRRPLEFRDEDQAHDCDTEVTNATRARRSLHLGLNCG